MILYNQVVQALLIYGGGIFVAVGYWIPEITRQQGIELQSWQILRLHAIRIVALTCFLAGLASAILTTRWWIIIIGLVGVAVTFISLRPKYDEGDDQHD